MMAAKRTKAVAALDAILVNVTRAKRAADLVQLLDAYLAGSDRDFRVNAALIHCSDVEWLLDDVHTRVSEIVTWLGRYHGPKDADEVLASCETGNIGAAAHAAFSYSCFIEAALAPATKGAKMSTPNRKAFERATELRGLLWDIAEAGASPRLKAGQGKVLAFVDPMEEIRDRARQDQIKRTSLIVEVLKGKADRRVSVVTGEDADKRYLDARSLRGALGVLVAATSETNQDAPDHRDIAAALDDAFAKATALEDWICSLGDEVAQNEILGIGGKS